MAPLPKDHFGIAGGTSSGGLIALMLFRFGMGTTVAIEKFETIVTDIFSPRIGGTFEALKRRLSRIRMLP